MPAITVRNVPDDTRNELAARASRTGRSLQEYLRQALIEIAAQPDLEQVLDDIRAARERSAGGMTTEDILDARDDGRR